MGMRVGKGERIGGLLEKGWKERMDDLKKEEGEGGERGEREGEREGEGEGEGNGEGEGEKEGEVGEGEIEEEKGKKEKESHQEKEKKDKDKPKNKKKQEKKPKQKKKQKNNQKMQQLPPSRDFLPLLSRWSSLSDSPHQMIEEVNSLLSLLSSSSLTSPLGGYVAVNVSSFQKNKLVEGREGGRGERGRILGHITLLFIFIIIRQWFWNQEIDPDGLYKYVLFRLSEPLLPYDAFAHVFISFFFLFLFLLFFIFFFA